MTVSGEMQMPEGTSHGILWVRYWTAKILAMLGFFLRGHCCPALLALALVST